MPASITLQTIDGKHQAKNDGLGNLTAPIVFSDRQPTQSDLDMLDEQGWDEVLFLVDNNGVLAVEPTSITLMSCTYLRRYSYNSVSILPAVSIMLFVSLAEGLIFLRTVPSNLIGCG